MINHLVDMLINTCQWLAWISLHCLVHNQGKPFNRIPIDLLILIRYKKGRLSIRWWEDFRNLCCHRLMPMSLPSW